MSARAFGPGSAVRMWVCFTALMMSSSPDSRGDADANRARVRLPAAGLELAQHAQMIRVRLCDALELRGDREWPAGGRTRGFDARTRIERAELQLPGIGVGAQHAEVGDHRARPGAGGAEVEPRYEAAHRLLHDDEYFARVAGDLGGAARARQAHARALVVADDRAVEVAEAVDLRSPEEADVDAAALQVIGEDLRQRYHAGRGFRELAVADREWQQLRPRADRAGLVDEHQPRGVRETCEIAGSARQPNADEAHRAVLELPCGSHRHHLIATAGRAAHAATPSRASSAP